MTEKLYLGHSNPAILKHIPIELEGCNQNYHSAPHPVRNPMTSIETSVITTAIVKAKMHPRRGHLLTTRRLTLRCRRSQTEPQDTSSRHRRCWAQEWLGGIHQR